MIDRALARAVLDRLVAFDTTSRNSNLALIAWVEDYLAQRGVASQRVYDDSGEKAGLLAIVGPPVPGGVVLSGHTDVVPIDGQVWSSDPWIVTQRDNRLYGRGVADMKSFLALSLAVLDDALAAPLARPLVLAFSYDEEVGCLGAPRLIEALVGSAPAPACVIVGEPTSMRCLSGNKGIRTFTVKVTGIEAHSSQVDLGASAIMAAIPLLALIDTMAQEARAAAPADSPFDPPFATMTVGLIEGGTAVNILARECQFVWDLRYPPDVDPSAYEDRFRALAAKIDADLRHRHPEAGVTVVQRSNTPGLHPTPDSDAERLIRGITGDNGFTVAAFAAEAGLFQAAGWPTAICGPGSIDQAHQPNEWIALEQFEAGAAFLDRLVATLARPT